ncbi:general odorant-binding protein 19d-like [Contarinia nasturtii]|uniref:general odorant-binding protein 19d-like n=1 Tax=Contarinia nasturtii TaxID=265458 RepID=UPI0012D3F35D|nr:general odorant-binding protein 19d-like [Contarinia nasturtii]
MNSLKIVGLVCVLILAVQGHMTDEDKKKLMEIGKECKEECKASDEDVGKLLKEELPSSEGGKCMPGCVMDKMEVMKKNGATYELQCDVMKKGAEERKMHADKVEKMMQSCQKCNTENKEAERKEAGLKLGECLHKASKENGLGPQ